MTQALVPIENTYKGVTFEVALRMMMQDGGKEAWSYVLTLPPIASGLNDEVFTCLRQFDDHMSAFAEAQSWAQRYIDASQGMTPD